MTLSNVPHFTGVNGHCALFSRLLLDGRLEPSEKILYGNCHQFQSWRSCWGKTAANGQNKITNPNGSLADSQWAPNWLPIVWKSPLVSILKKVLMVKIKLPTDENMFKNRDILLKQSSDKKSRQFNNILAEYRSAGSRLQSCVVIGRKMRRF